MVAAGGAAVIGAIALIFAYLLWVVAPIFFPGDAELNPTIPTTARTPILVDVSENGEVYLRLTREGIAEFYEQTGAAVAAYDLGHRFVRAARLYPSVDLYLLVDEAFNAHFVRAQYIVDFTEGTRRLLPKIDFAFKQGPVAVGPHSDIDAQLVNGELLIAHASGKHLTLTQFKNVEEGFALGTPRRVRVPLILDAEHVFLGARNEWVSVVGSNGQIEVIGIRTLDSAERLYQGYLVASGRELTAVGPLLGRYSLMAANDQGLVTQWGVVRDAYGYKLANMRTFQLDGPVHRMVAEPRRKGFGALQADGTLAILYPTSKRVVVELPTRLAAAMPIAIGARSDVLVAAVPGGGLQPITIHNEHPEISFSALWSKIWYEGYEEPIFSWQSSSADNDFEPKFSLTPLAFGTLKAAFYALLFAVPIAIMGAIYTAYFMAPAMRAWVKPGIEIMAALPTVILGFIGGLWLAPLIEENLSSMLAIGIVLPATLIVLALIWSALPEKLTKPCAGWYGLIASPLIVIAVYIAFDVGPFLEALFFGGDSRSWFREVLGLNYDQRNALVVGLIMGLAVIPTIFSIAEDAIYGVPQHLINGSLALGATPWQTLVGVVILTASPGIFSAVMIGMGRAVGETMIVLMATGNTPLMDFNIFEGMRTFAANIAVELPESEVDSTHYRILFLAALVLFILTFIFNTLAELVRQRLRTRYGNL